jgi:predicted nucleic acid binding AN1-type Zn finger protein
MNEKIIFASQLFFSIVGIGFCLQQIIANNTADQRSIYLPILVSFLSYWMPTKQSKQKDNLLPITNITSGSSSHNGDIVPPLSPLSNRNS